MNFKNINFYLNIILFFFITCISAWLFEVSFCFLRFGFTCNRGMLHGPWLPIYGFGALFMYIINILSKKDIKKFIVYSFLLAFTLEYLTSYILEKSYGIIWWDYSDYFLNINGRVCLLYLIGFVVLGLIAIYILKPTIDKGLNKLPYNYRLVIILLLVLLFTIDISFSLINPNTGVGVSSYVSQIK